MTTLLAPDRALPQRDLLLDPTRVAPVLERRLGPVELTRCEVARVKYRVGESLRVRYTVEAGGQLHDVACRAFAPGRGKTAYERALGNVVATGELRPVGWAPELETVFWTFPNDRRLCSNAVAELPGLLGPSLRSCHLVAYAPEKSATIRCDGVDGALAYAKLYGGPGAGRAFALHRRLAAAGMRVPKPLDAVRSLQLLLVAPLAGRPLAELEGAQLVQGHRLLGEAIAQLHRLPPLDRARFRRLDSDRVRSAAALVARVRPDVADTARDTAAEIARRETDEPDVCVHGDLHPKNALVDGDRVGLVDLDQTARGAASAELGSLFAGLCYARAVGRLDVATERGCAAAVAEGYATVRPLPSAAALRRATAAALLAERAVRAVNRVRPEGLAALRPLLAEARERARA